MTTKEMVVKLFSGNMRQICGNAEWFRTNDREYAKELVEDVFIIADLINEVNDERLLKQNAEYNSKKNSKKNSLGTKGCYLCT